LQTVVFLSTVAMWCGICQGQNVKTTNLPLCAVQAHGLWSRDHVFDQVCFPYELSASKVQPLWPRIFYCRSITRWTN
jgi:hypothetical protein